MAGNALALLVLRSDGLSGPLCWLIPALLLLAHLWRDVEYLAHWDNPSCINPPLFVVNNVKVAGLIAVLLFML